MKRFLKLIIVPALLIALVVSYLEFDESVKKKATTESIKFIRDHMNGTGKIIDYYDEIGVEGLEDIKLFIKEEDVKIEFGKVILTWSMEDFLKPENIELLNSVGIEVFREKDTGKLRIFYNGKELERWVS